jgi:hypothetical protein
VIGNRKGLGQWRVIGRRTEGMVVKAEVGSLVASGLPQSSVSSWAAIQPHVTDDFDRDLDRYISYWEQTYRLLSALPAKPSRSDVERAAAQTLLTAGRDSRERFLNAYTRQLYDSLTAQRSHFVRVDQLVAAAADAFPGLVPSEAQLAAESNLKQGDKDGLEIDQGIFLSHPCRARLGHPPVSFDAVAAPRNRGSCRKVSGFGQARSWRGPRRTQRKSRSSHHGQPAFSQCRRRHDHRQHGAGR